MGSNLSITQSLNHFLHSTMSNCKFCSDVIHSDMPISSNELINSFIVALCGGNLRLPTVRLILDTRVPILEIFHPSPNTAGAHADIFISMFSSLTWNSMTAHCQNKHRCSHFGNRSCGHMIAANNVRIWQYVCRLQSC